ncbi:hypothetical protein Fmac_026342 [Flemingia macrophylla]|uniref:Uncharacterized protein n=1 Tax=Flemingia macrophylla TaxID=520843 RepID=A0ABD1LF45_9FABA
MEHKAFWVLKRVNFEHAAAGEKRKTQLAELEEMRLKAYESSKLRLFPGKLKSKWSRPFKVKNVMSHGAVKIENPSTERSWVVNGQRLKVYVGGEVLRLTTVVKFQE